MLLSKFKDYQTSGSGDFLKVLQHLGMAVILVMLPRPFL